MATISENLQILKNSITSIKRAIVNKCGSVEGNITTYADYINNINTNTGDNQSPKPASISDVNFLDYDGTILYSYTKEQFITLSAMPELPTRKGLICQGWNWTIEEAKEYVDDYGMLNIGAMYITDDGDTRLYIRIASEGRMRVPLYWNQTISNGVGIDWGDGSDVQTFSGTGNLNYAHTYEKAGNYVIRLKVADDCTLGLGPVGSGTTNLCVMGGTGDNSIVYCNMLQKVEIGARITSIDGSSFTHCYSLASISIPNSVVSLSGSSFTHCYSLASISIPNSVVSLSGSVFGYCYSLASISIPNSVTSIGNSAFYYCYSLASISIPNSVTSIAGAAFNYCYSLASISIPNSVTSIAGSTFQWCCGMAIYDFTNHTSVPTLDNKNAFSYISQDCKIKVPESLLEEWKTATNWSTYSNYIVAG